MCASNKRTKQCLCTSGGTAVYSLVAWVRQLPAQHNAWRGRHLGMCVGGRVCLVLLRGPSTQGHWTGGMLADEQNAW